MSKKRPTESSWDSDEELLSDTSGITAFPKQSELDVLADEGELDEDALLSIDEANTKSMSVSFANDTMHSHATRNNSTYSRASMDMDQVADVDQQAFVFEEVDTGDLEAELNVAGDEDMVYQGNQYGDDAGYGGEGFHQDGGGDASQQLAVSEGYDAGMPHPVTDQTHDYQPTHTGDASYAGTEEAASAYQEPGQEVAGYMAHGEEEDGNRTVELEYEQPEEQNSQVHLEYEVAGNAGVGDAEVEQSGDGHFESDSDSDDETSRRGRGKFTSERTGVISLAAATERSSIPDTLEINDEQAAKLEKFMTDKPQRGKKQTGPPGKLNVRSRLGNRPPGNVRPPPQMGRPGPGMQGPVFPLGPRGPLNPRMLMGILQRGGIFRQGLMNQPGMPLHLGLQGRFPDGPMNPRGLLPMGPGRGPFPRGQRQMVPEGMRHQGPRSRAMMPPGPRGGPPGRFPGGPNMVNPLQGPEARLRGLGMDGMRPGGPNRMPGPPNMPQRILMEQLRQAGPRMGMQGPRMGMQGPPGQIRPLMSEQPSLRGPMSPRGPMPNQPGGRSVHDRLGPRTPGSVAPGQMSGPRPLVSNKGQSNPSLVRTISQSGAQQQPTRPQQQPTRPQPPSLMQQRPLNPRFVSSAGQRMPGGPGPRFRQPPPGGPMARPQLGLPRHKIYINPRFQDPKGPGDRAPTGITRTVRMGLPMHQRRAKALVERAVQQQKRPQMVAPRAPVQPVKRKSSGGDDLPNKVGRMADGQAEQLSEPPKFNRLLEEQKRKRDMIVKRKELARQRQAAQKRRELEQKLAEQGKSIDDVLPMAGENQFNNASVSGASTIPTRTSVNARLGPPPSLVQPNRPQAPMAFQRQGPRPTRPAGAFQNISTIGKVGGNLSRSPMQAPSPRFQNPRGPQPRMTTPNHPSGPRQAFSRPPPPQSPGSHRMPAPASRNVVFQQRPPSVSTSQFQTPPPTLIHQKPRGPSPSESWYQGHPSPQSQQTRPPNPQPAHVAPQAAYQGHPPHYPPHGPPQHPPPAQPPAQAAFQQLPPQFASQAPHPRPAIPPPAPSPAHHHHQPPPSTHFPPPNFAPQINQPPRSYPPAAAPTQYAPPASHQPPPQAQAPYDPNLYSQAPAPSIPQHTYRQPPPQALTQPSAPTHYVAPSVADPQQPVHHHQVQQQQQQQQQQQLQQQQYYNYGASTEVAQTQYQPPVSHTPYQNPVSQTYQSTYSPYASQQPVGFQQDQRTVQHQSRSEGQKIQTIGSRLQPAPATDMRSIIHSISASRSGSSVLPRSSGRVVQTQQHGQGRVVVDTSSSSREGPSKVVMLNVPDLASRETLIKVCRHFGRVLGLQLIKEQGKAYVQFQTGEEAAKCVAKCNQKCLHKTRLTVKLLPD